MEQPVHRFRISTILNTATGLIFLVCCLVFLVLLKNNLQKMALQEAESKSRIILDRNLATHYYFSQIMKPKLFEWTEPFREKDYFDPAWMSSTYAVRAIDDFFQSINETNYYYKECAISARNPKNEADEYESKFLLELQYNPDLNERSDIRYFDGKPYFVHLRRGEMMEESCLRCHSTPDKAPQQMLARYGQDTSFHRQVGDVVSAISIRVPLSEAYVQANRLTQYLLCAFVILLIVIFTSHFMLYKGLLFSPLDRLRRKALDISSNPEFLGQEIPDTRIVELRDLIHSFNLMSRSVKENVDHLEERVEERTVELSETNAQLKEALEKVKMLSGFLPICSSCKKIRDDQGYWNQIEAYIEKHSDTEFSHGICPECAKKLYPDYYSDED